jgi:hypothetical protein
MARRFPLASRALVLILSGAPGCGGDLLLPDPPGGGENVLLSKVDGDNQEGVVGEALQKPLIVRVLTARELPVIGREVEFVFTSAAGEVSPAQARTNSLGEATANWKLGTEPGPQTVAARLVVADTTEAQVEEFTAQAKPAAPDTLSAKSPTSQPGRRNHKVDAQPVVQVVDRFGNPVPQVSVAWQVTVGEGSVSEAITLTKDDGTTTVEWTLGGRRGVQRLTAAVGPGPVSGSPVSFTATVLF